MDYKKLSIGLALVVAFLAGCVVHDVVRVTPPARAGVPVQRWEYHCDHISSSVEDLDSESDNVGAQGWEMAAATGAVVCFKRPLP